MARGHPPPWPAPLRGAIPFFPSRIRWSPHGDAPATLCDAFGVGRAVPLEGLLHLLLRRVTEARISPLGLALSASALVSATHT